MKKVSSCLVLLLLLSLSAFAQTTTEYHATTGTVTGLNAVTAQLDLGGNFSSPNTYGAGCTVGHCPHWEFANFTLNYTLPDGTTAKLTNFSGYADFTSTSTWPFVGTASGTDSTGAAVQVNVNWTVHLTRNPRGSGYTKHFGGGYLQISQGQ
jgi:hypothetical protein